MSISLHPTTFLKKNLCLNLLSFLAFVYSGVVQQMNCDYKLQHNLEELRFQDQVKTWACSYPDMVLPEAFILSLNRLLELADSKQISRKVKYAMRSIFISLAVRCDDISCAQDTNSLQKTSYYYVLNSQTYRKHSHHSLLLDDLVANDDYFLSQKHQQIHSNIAKIVEGNSQICSPYDFIPLFKDSIGGRQQSLQYLIDLLLSVPESYFVSSEELFVSACYILVEKFHLKPLRTILESYFQMILQKNEKTVKAIKQAFEKVIGDA